MFGKGRNINDLEKKIQALREEIPVNLELKERLRREFMSGTPPRKRPNMVWAAVLATAMMLALWLGLGNRESGPTNPVLAADLKVSNQVSLLDIAAGSNLPPVIGPESMYIPVTGEGTFEVSLKPEQSGTVNKVSNSDVIFSSLSHDGRTAAYVTSKGICLYDLRTKASRTLIEGNDYDIYYEEPSWSDDNQTLLITRRQIAWLEHGYDVKSVEIYEIDRNGKNLRRVVSGSRASYIPGSNHIVFERDGKIMVKRGAEEEVVDEGRFPAVSPDGKYIAYVKRTKSEKTISDEASVVTELSDVFVRSLSNYSDGRKLTSNYPFRHIPEEDWVTDLKPAMVKQVLVYTGMYDFYNPVWGKDSSTLFVLKGGNSEQTPMRITRIDLSPQDREAKETVARWFEARINRDDDFARSMMQHPPKILTVSNPHPVAYSITGSGTKNGQTYVDAEETAAYNADSYYVLSRTRFYLAKDKEGFKIERMEDRNGGFQVLGGEDGIYLVKAGEEKETLLLPVKGITPPGEVNMRRLSSLAYSPEKQLLIYTIQELGSFTIYAHDLKRDKEVFSHRVKEGESAVMDVSIDGSQRYVAIRYYGDSHLAVKLYDVANNRLVKAPFLDNAGNAFWANERLLVEKDGAGGTIRWVFDPDTGKVTLGS